MSFGPSTVMAGLFAIAISSCNGGEPDPLYQNSYAEALDTQFETQVDLPLRPDIGFYVDCRVDRNVHGYVMSIDQTIVCSLKLSNGHDHVCTVTPNSIENRCQIPDIDRALAEKKLTVSMTTTSATGLHYAPGYPRIAYAGCPKYVGRCDLSSAKFINIIHRFLPTD